jgi:hypothetical protein
VNGNETLLRPATVLCELTNLQGTMVQGTDIEIFLSIEELVDHKIRVSPEANA